MFLGNYDIYQSIKSFDMSFILTRLIKFINKLFFLECMVLLSVIILNNNFCFLNRFKRLMKFILKCFIKDILLLVFLYYFLS